MRGCRDSFLIVVVLSFLCALREAFSEECFIHSKTNYHELCFVSSYDSIHSSTSSEDLNLTDIELSINDSDKGILDVKFPIFKKYRDYAVQLNVVKHDDIKHGSKEECNTNTDNYILHSERHFNVFSCKEDIHIEECYPDNSCSGFAVLKFFHVYSSCYSVTIIPRNTSSYGKAVTKFKRLESHYKKKMIVGEKPSVDVRIVESNHAARVVINYSLVRELPVLLTLHQGVNLQNSDGCSKTGHKHSCCHLDGEDENKSHCQISNIKNHNDKLIPSCKVEKDTITCLFWNLTQGNYCLIIEALEDRCKKGTVWNHNESGCSFHHSFVYPPPDSMNTYSVPNNSRVIITLGTIAVVAAFLLLIGGFCFCVRRFYPNGTMEPQFLSASGHQPLVTSHPRILLLYAQDCEPFMNLMCTFRSFLSTVGRCEVLDCFDGAWFEYIAPAPDDWIRRNVNSLKVIVVVSDCSVELQSRSFNTRQQYESPLPYNNLFLVGLKEITSSISAHEYHRIFVIKFDNNDLSSLTPYTRYFLPNDLQHLLEGLDLMHNPSNIDEINISEILSKRIGEYLQYKKENPQYMKNLMTLERIV